VHPTAQTSGRSDPLYAGMTARRPRFAALLLAVLLALTLTLTPRAEAFVYWADFGSGRIGRANLDGTDVNPRFTSGVSFGLGFPSGVAVDAAHIYWADGGANTIARANLDGTGADPSFITGLTPDWVAVDAAHVYWANGGAGTIGRANLDGTGPIRASLPPRPPVGWRSTPLTSTGPTSPPA
jgi:sugar lactone lactonase YvrE